MGSCVTLIFKQKDHPAVMDVCIIYSQLLKYVSLHTSSVKAAAAAATAEEFDGVWELPEALNLLAAQVCPVTGG